MTTKKVGRKKNPLSFNPFGDTDKDGVPNITDCDPLDPTRDGFFGDLARRAMEAARKAAETARRSAESLRRRAAEATGAARETLEKKAKEAKRVAEKAKEAERVAEKVVLKIKPKIKPVYKKAKTYVPKMKHYKAIEEK